MTFTENQRRVLERLHKKHRIQFDWRLPHASLSREQQRIFGNIRKLAETKYDDYAVDPSQDYSREPWKLEAKDLALRLTERAERCRRRNEASWRYACEPLVFARVNADVACPRCRQRLWRSEIEASRDDESRGAAALKKRQEGRQPCRCPPSFRGLDLHEAKGISRIFTHREEESIIHTATITEELPKGEKPDRVYGLRETRNFDVALQKQAQLDATQDGPDGSNKLVLDLVKVSPYSLDGERLLFPFLFLEAKSGKSPDDWGSIKLQTCFPIRTALEVQRGLQLANGAKSRWKAGPLVWFLMSKGEDWRLCLAFTEEKGHNHQNGGEITYHILDLWNGSILTNDGALQLILIVDHIFDWARDIYRPDILMEIQLLAADTSAVATVLPDSDIFSTRETASLEMTDNLTQTEMRELRPMMAAFRALDSPRGMVRHAAFIESRFCALFITRDNVETLLQSTKPNTIQLLARQILTQIADEPLNVGIDTLDGIEEQWTGNARFSRPFNLTQTKFYAVITFAAYMTPWWEQVRELYVLAVAEDAFKSLVEYSKLRHGRGKAQVPESYPVDKDAVMREISRFQNGSRSATLMTTIRRTHERLREDPFSRTGLSFVADKGIFRDMVHYVYISFKKGVFEPSESFLQVSNRFEQIQTVNSDSWDGGREDLHDPNATAVLVHGYGRRHDPQRSKQSNICIFLLQDSLEAPDYSTLATILRNTFENDDVYHTTRDNGTSNIKAAASRPTWNLEDTYEIRYWRKVARERKERVIWCCQCCASTDLPSQDDAWMPGESEIPGDICDFCIQELDWPEYPRWVSDALMGKDSICWKPVGCPNCDVSEESESSILERKRHWCGCNRWSYARASADHEEWYRQISRYRGLEEPYEDLRDLIIQARRYHIYRRKRFSARIKSSAGTKRQHSSGVESDRDNQSETDDTDTDVGEDSELGV